jgi:hypothetical protein
MGTPERVVNPCVLLDGLTGLVWEVNKRRERRITVVNRRMLSTGMPCWGEWVGHVAIATIVTTLVLACLVAAQAMASACANETLDGFREYLSGCGAYEMVTPDYGDGFRGNIIGVAPDGATALDKSVGAFGGVESNGFGSVYSLNRGDHGWTAETVNPPASTWPASSFFAASADETKTLWAVRRADQSIYATDLYVRGLGAVFTRVGSVAPPGAVGGPPAGGYQLFPTQAIFAGASADLSHILFQLKGNSAPFWPGDTTVGGPAGSLYEYRGVNNAQPALVGVSNSGAQISSCGTVIGGPEPGGEATVDAYNAVSADGSIVFFSAQGHSNGNCGPSVPAPEVTELYARVAGIESVPISEPSNSQCNECVGHGSVETGRRPAEFRGASLDGTKVAFLTEQEMLPGDATENLYEYDFNNPNGHKLLRVSVGATEPEVQGVVRLSEDGSHVYFVAKGILTEGTNAEGQAPVPGGENLYVFERNAAHPGGHTAFVATLAEGDQGDWQASDNRPAQATPDGRFLVFRSVADLTSGDTSTVPQVFEYDAVTAQLVRVSVAEAGYALGETSADEHESLLPVQLYRENTGPSQRSTRLAVSADGSEIVFASAAALTPLAEPAAAAGMQSTYVYRSSGGIANGAVSLVSSGTNVTRNAPVIGIDAAGSNIFFETLEPLLPLDGNTQFDLYDARSDGGFAITAPRQICEGDACQGPPIDQPVFALPPSIAQQGGDNLAPPAPSPAPLHHPTANKKALAKALKACNKKPKKKRPRCRREAKKRFASKSSIEGRRP